MISKSWQSLRSSSRRRWGLALLALVLIVVVSMVIGIIVNATRSGQSYTYSENASTAGGYAVAPQASSASNAPGAVSGAGGSKNSAAPSSGGTTAASSVGSQSTADQSLPARHLRRPTKTKKRRMVSHPPFCCVLPCLPQPATQKCSRPSKPTKVPERGLNER